MQDEKKRHRAWSMEHGVKSIADLSYGLPPFGRVPSLGFRIADLETRSQESGARSQ
jgi:hypothetical protein